VQIIQGMATDTVQIRDMARQMPQRMIKFFTRVASLRQGKYIIVYTVGNNGKASWQISEIGAIESTD